MPLGGSPGRAGATSRGVRIAALRALRGSPEGRTVAVQGFGKVGAPAARYLSDAGCRVVAVSDVTGAVVARSGLDLDDLRAWAKETGGVHGYRHADALSHEELLELDVDVLVPAAMEGAITAENAPRIRARLIVEGANGPDHAGGGPDPGRCRDRRGPRHPGQRGRRDRLLPGVAAEHAGVLLELRRGRREDPRPHGGRRSTRSRRCPRRAGSPCARPPT